MDSTVKESRHGRQPLGEIDLNIEYLSSSINSCTMEIGEPEVSDQFSIDLNENVTDLGSDFDQETSNIAFNNDRAPSFDLNQHPPIEEMYYSHDSLHDTDLDDEERPKKKKKELNNDERRAIYDALLQRSVNGKLKRDTTRTVAELFSISIRTVQRIWKMSKDNTINGLVDVSHRKTKNCGRKRIQVDLNQIRDIELKRRTTLESTACALGISKSTLFRLLQSGVLRRHTNPIKSDLTEDNKKARLYFCLSMLDPSSLPHDPIFLSMENVVHIDEKWFYMTKKTEKYYLLWDEEDPLRTCKSKSFIGKVMFLVAVARPRFDAEGKEVFSGKIGVFPLVTYEPAKRTSVNRVAGTFETKPITSIGKDVIRSFLIEKVIPAIRAKWPRGEKGPIFIQQDNARPHIRPDDTDFCAAASVDGFDIRLICQPPNSPDLNVLDLGFFSAIQALQYKECPKNVDELVSAVVRSFENFSTIKSNRVFLTLQMCMMEIMKIGGSNKYRIPHLKKAILEREGRLPFRFKCDATLVQDVISHLS